MTTLIYIGNGAAIIGIPARDLTEQDLQNLKEFGMKEIDLLASGLYVKKDKFEFDKSKSVDPSFDKGMKKEIDYTFDKQHEKALKKDKAQKEGE